MIHIQTFSQVNKDITNESNFKGKNPIYLLDSGFLVNRNMDCIRDGLISSVDLSFQSLRKKKTGTLESSSQSRLKAFWKKYLDKVCLFHEISSFS